MSTAKRISIAAGAVFVIAVGALALYWTDQNGRLDDLRAAVEQFEPPTDWADWTLVEEIDRGYSPFCVDSECPSSYRRFATLVPAGDVTSDVRSALEGAGYLDVEVVDQGCLAGARCRFTTMLNGVEVRIGTNEIFGVDREAIGRDDVPSDLVALSVTVAAD